eukprot:m.54797 g.54797  ORF g.54797 m.54797 type:complete len:291 (-) comp12896_c0_seq3:123-995(-)
MVMTCMVNTASVTSATLNASVCFMLMTPLVNLAMVTTVMMFNASVNILYYSVFMLLTASLTLAIVMFSVVVLLSSCCAIMDSVLDLLFETSPCLPSLLPSLTCLFVFSFVPILLLCMGLDAFACCDIGLHLFLFLRISFALLGFLFHIKGVKGSTVDLRPEFRILHTSFIKDCQSPDQETLKIKAPSYVDVEERKAGLDRAVSQAQKILVSDRPGVPDIAIRVYADLAKTMNPKWGPNDTIILQNVEISAPYDETSCRSLSAQVPKPTVQAIRDRVRNTNEAYKASVAAK